METFTGGAVLAAKGSGVVGLCCLVLVGAVVIAVFLLLARSRRPARGGRPSPYRSGYGSGNQGRYGSSRRRNDGGDDGGGDSGGYDSGGSSDSGGGGCGGGGGGD